MHVVIIGNGISGTTAARWLRKLSDHQVTIISSESKHFFSRTALMYIYMGHMRYEDTKPYEDWFWEKNKINLIQGHVNSIDFNNQQLTLDSNDSINYDKLILALGSKSNKFGWPGQDLKAVSGLYHLQDLEQMEAHSSNLKRAVVVGGGLIGIEMAEMFKSRDIAVSMIVREQNYWDNVLPEEESKLISKHIRDHHIDLRLGVNLDEIIDDGTGKACGIKIKETSEVIDCGYVGLTAGVSPNIGLVKESELACNRGILVDEYLKTNMDNVYAIGDCAELKEARQGRRSIEAVWYTGRMMGETVAYNICGKTHAYDPGIWFNSAKFLDIEYQVYGNVQNRVLEHQKSLLWVHSDQTKSIRILYHKSTGQVEGFNLLGIRFRHEVCEKWLSEKTHIEAVLQDLSLANFEPEFYKTYEAELVGLYNKQEGKQLSLKSSGSLNAVFSFLKK